MPDNERISRPFDASAVPWREDGGSALIQTKIDLDSLDATDDPTRTAEVTKVNAKNLSGPIKLDGAKNKPSVTLTATVVAHTKDDAVATVNAINNSLVIKKHDSGKFVVRQRRTWAVLTGKTPRLHMAVTVPPDRGVVVSATSHGDVTGDGVIFGEGSSVKSYGHDVRLTDSGGDVTAKATGNGTVTLENFNGQRQTRTSRGDITIANSNGTGDDRTRSGSIRTIDAKGASLVASRTRTGRTRVESKPPGA